MRRIDLRRNDGVALTEFALIVPSPPTHRAGLLGFGRVFFYWIEANHPANETARWATVDQNPFNRADSQDPAAAQSYRRVREVTSASASTYPDRWRGRIGDRS